MAANDVSTGVRLVRVPEDRDGQRLDNFLLLQLKGAPRSLVYKLVRSGQVRVNGGRAKADWAASRVSSFCCIMEMVSVSSVSSRPERRSRNVRAMSATADAVLQSQTLTVPSREQENTLRPRPIKPRPSTPPA